MTEQLWDFAELAAAAGGGADGVASGAITGISIDTRTLAPGDLFVALRDARDGHEFVTKAFEAGAVAALVADTYARKPGDGALIRVGDPLQGLEGVGRAARARLGREARVFAVTGSVGKTGTKEMLRVCLARVGPTHAADKSFNNHWGVPLTLARMPAGTRYGVFEIGMNHAGEIAPLVKLVRPHVAIVTTVEPVHLEFFASIEAIAEAKAEIFLGLEPGGTAILNADNRQFDLLARRAREAGARIVTFGVREPADVRPVRRDLFPDGSDVEVSVGGRSIAYRLGTPGAHVVQNSLAVVAALYEAGIDLDAALPALAGLAAQTGRGARIELPAPGGSVLVIDESYNANPASMRAALALLGSVPRETYQRRIAVMGDMLELGPRAPLLHKDLKEAVDAAGADLVFACGPNMAHLIDSLPMTLRGAWAETSEGIGEALLAEVRAGDVVMVKGSLGSRMAPLVAALKERFEPAAARA
jgi:UDP-N-acetylmuramoyl-tripeptide--D-alanyl-D-alanine ligase